MRLGKYQLDTYFYLPQIEVGKYLVGMEEDISSTAAPTNKLELVEKNDDVKIFLSVEMSTRIESGLSCCVYSVSRCILIF